MAYLIQREHPFKNPKGFRGFTLIEMMAVMVILSIILSPIFYWYGRYEDARKVKITQERVADAYESLMKWRKFNGFFPLPAGVDIPRPMTGAAADNQYGRSLPDALRADILGKDNGKCAFSVCIQGTNRAADSALASIPLASLRVIVGALPFRDINMREQDSYDAYGSRLYYAVSYPLTQRATFQENRGLIQIQRQDGGVTTDLTGATPSSFQFIVFSVGPNKKGGYSREGVPLRACAGGSDAENCDFLAGVGTGTGPVNALFFMNDGSKFAGSEYDDIMAINSNFSRSPWLQGVNPNDVVYSGGKTVAIGSYFTQNSASPWTYQMAPVNAAALHVGFGTYGVNPSVTSTDSANWADGMLYVQNRIRVNQICDLQNRCFTLDKLLKTCPAGEYITGFGDYDGPGGNEIVRCGPVYMGCTQENTYFAGLNAVTGEPICNDIPATSTLIDEALGRLLPGAGAYEKALAAGAAAMGAGGRVADLSGPARDIGSLVADALSRDIIHSGGTAEDVAALASDIARGAAAAVSAKSGSAIEKGIVAGMAAGRAGADSAGIEAAITAAMGGTASEASVSAVKAAVAEIRLEHSATDILAAVAGAATGVVGKDGSLSDADGTVVGGIVGSMASIIGASGSAAISAARGEILEAGGPASAAAIAGDSAGVAVATASGSGDSGIGRACVAGENRTVNDASACADFTGTFTGICDKAGATADTADDCGDKKYDVTEKKSCSPESWTPISNNTQPRCCAAPNGYTDTYETTPFVAAGGGNWTRTSFTIASVSLPTISLSGQDSGNVYLYKRTGRIQVTRRRDSGSCKMNLIEVKWNVDSTENVKRDLPTDAVEGENRWWSASGLTLCDPDGTGATFGPSDGYRYYQQPICDKSPTSKPASGIHTDGRWQRSTYNYGFDASAGYNCKQNDLYMWISDVRTEVGLTGRTEDPGLPVLEKPDGCSRDQVGQTTMCQQLQSDGTYTTYKNCKCTAKGRPAIKFFVGRAELPFDLSKPDGTGSISINNSTGACNKLPN